MGDRGYSTRSWRSAGALAAGLFVSLIAPAIPAQQPPGEEPSSDTTPSTANEALATELFNAGRDLIAQGRYAEACPKLVESNKLAPKVGTLAKLGECEEKLGQLVSARARWLQAQNLARVYGDPRLTQVEAELARVDTMVPKLRLVLPQPQPAGLEIRLDDLAIGAGGWGLPIPLDPGQHTLTASATGKQPWTKALQVKAGALIDVPIPALDGVAAPPAPVAPLPLPPPESSSPLVTIGIVTIGVGVVGLVAGAYFAGVAQAKVNESNIAGCHGDQCSTLGAEVRNDARDAGDASTAFFIAGGALAAGGLTLSLVASQSKPRGPSVQVSAGGGPRASGVVIRGAW